MERSGLEQAVEEVPQVWALYLFGSRARGDEQAGSDVDLAVLLDPTCSAQETWKLRLELADRLSQHFTSAVDVVVLGEDLDLTFRVLKEGKRLWVRDHDQVCAREASLLCQYYDYLPFLNSYLESVAKEFRQVG